MCRECSNAARCVLYNEAVLVWLEKKAFDEAIQYELMLLSDDGADVENFDSAGDESFARRAKQRAFASPEMRTATMIRVINGSDEACFLPGLSATDRIWRFHLVSFLYAALLGDDAMSPHGDASTSTLGGFASSVFKAFATNAAALTQALAARSPSQGAALPPALRTLLRAWCETDDLELGFSQMLANAGWKGDAEQMKRVGARSEVKAMIRRNADRGFVVSKSTKSACVNESGRDRSPIATVDPRD